MSFSEEMNAVLRTVVNSKGPCGFFADFLGQSYQNIENDNDDDSGRISAGAETGPNPVTHHTLHPVTRTSSNLFT